MSLRYCKSCVYPSTKPGLSLDAEGICSGCRNQKLKRSINWDERFEKLRSWIAARRTGNGYDCLIPVSGGKDSHAQVYYAKEVLKLNPLCITVRPQASTEIGRRNLENLKKRFAVDLVALEARDDVERQLTVSCFLDKAWPNWAHDKLIYSWPLRFAAAHRIPLVIMGENHDFETGGKDLGEGSAAARQMLHSLDGEATDAFLKQAGITRADFLPYLSPTQADMDAAGTEVIWLGYYVNWDSFEIYRLAEKCGFQHDAGTKDGLIDNYHGIDDATVMMNAWLKFIKFGFGRVSDVAFNHISYGRMTRAEAIELVNEKEGILDSKLKRAWLDYTGLDEERFDATVRRFANPAIVTWQEGRWRLKDRAV